MLKKISFDDIWDSMIKEYPNQEQCLLGYIKVHDELLELEPCKNDGMIIVVEHVKDILEDDWYYSVSGIEEGKEQRYALDFIRWEYWLSYPVDIQCDISEAEALAHILWEMTYSGFEQKEIQDKMTKISDSVKEVKKQLKKERG